MALILFFGLEICVSVSGCFVVTYRGFWRVPVQKDKARRLKLIPCCLSFIFFYPVAMYFKKKLRTTALPCKAYIFFKYSIMYNNIYTIFNIYIFLFFYGEHDEHFNLLFVYLHNFQSSKTNSRQQYLACRMQRKEATVKPINTHIFDVTTSTVIFFRFHCLEIIRLLVVNQNKKK